MVNEKFIKNALGFQDLTEEEKQKRGILGRLYGPIADIINPTRNGRGYSEDLWKKVFKDPIVQELLAKGGIPGELDHPEERQEICSDRIAIMMPEAPKEDEDGHLIAYFDILDTPCGKIAYQLAKYGFKLGVSSRGSGDVYTDDNGNEAVDPDSYDFKCFDLVLIPAVEDARMTFTESLHTFKKALNEALSKEPNNIKQDMNSIVEDLFKDCSTDKVNNINESDVQTNNNESGVDDVKPNDLIKSLQEALSLKSKAEAKVLELQEQLAVGNSKVDELSDEVNRYKQATIRLSAKANENKELTKKVQSLNEQLSETQSQLEIKSKKITRLLKEQSSSKQLNEAISTKDITIEGLTKRIEELERKVKLAENSKKRLEEKYTLDINNLKESVATNKNNNSEKVAKALKLAEQYKSTIYNVIDRYIDSKAKMLGVTSNEIKNRLNENYTLDEVDEVCTNILNETISISNLPFALTKGKSVKAKISSAKNDVLSNVANYESNLYDDEIDDSLISMFNSTKQEK